MAQQGEKTAPVPVGEKNGKGGNENGKDEVFISVDGTQYKVHRGSLSVIEIKVLAGISSVDKVAKLEAGQLQLLDDAGKVTIKGGEDFRKVPNGGQSS